jgi:hypothetical protein
MSPLVWAPVSSGNQFIFLDDNLLSWIPNQTNGLITIGPACDRTEVFNDITTLVPHGWVMQNNSQPGPGATGWFQGITAVFPSQSGAANSYIAANYDNGTGTSTLSNWLLTPKRDFAEWRPVKLLDSDGKHSGLRRPSPSADEH